MKFSRNAKRGLSLIEMLVVLGVIVAVAGMIVVNATGALDKTSDSTIAATLNDLKSSINSYSALNSNTEPNQYETLVEQAGGTLFYGVSPLVTSANELDVLTVDASNGLDALIAAGITDLYEMNTQAAAGDATYTDTTLASPTSITGAGASIVLAELDEDALPDLNLLSGAVHVAFGVGQRCTLVGNGIEDAPTCAPTNGTPVDRYSRFLVIYQLTDAGGTPLAKAKRVEVLSTQFKNKAQHEAQFHTQN